METGRVGDSTTDRATITEQLSALIDGELGDPETANACSQWRNDAELRRSWHAYHLIGDVLRSDDLCGAPGRDAAFLVALRVRLADEPVVLAPQATTVAAAAAAAGVAGLARRPAWRPQLAVAAGFVAVVGVVVAMRFTSQPDAQPRALARSAGDPALVSASADAVGGGLPAASSEADTRGLVASGQLIRDVRLDRYLSAHKQFAGSSALGVPSGFLRNATADAADR